MGSGPHLVVTDRALNGRKQHVKMREAFEKEIHFCDVQLPSSRNETIQSKCLKQDVLFVDSVGFFLPNFASLTFHVVLLLKGAQTKKNGPFPGTHFFEIRHPNHTKGSMSTEKGPKKGPLSVLDEARAQGTDAQRPLDNTSTW